MTLTIEVADSMDTALANFLVNARARTKRLAANQLIDEHRVITTDAELLSTSEITEVMDWDI